MKTQTLMLQNSCLNYCYGIMRNVYLSSDIKLFRELLGFEVESHLGILLVL